MNVQVIAAGRTVFIADCHGEQADCAGLALDLWERTAPETPAEVGPGFGFSTEIKPEKDEPSYVSYGERPLIK